MSTNAVKFTIVDGPSKDKLFDACKYVYDEEINVPIVFSVKGTEETSDFFSPVGVTELQAIRCRELEKDLCLEGIIGGVSFPGENTICHFSAYYDAKSRKGSMTVFSD